MRTFAAITCFNCGEDGPGYRQTCGCALCLVCLQGIVSTCPACHQPVAMWDRQTWERKPGDFSGWAWVVGLLALSLFALWVVQ